MSEDNIDILIDILKYTGIPIGSVSGIIGLFIDFKDKATNKINKKGYLILIFIVSSGMVSILSQSFELYRDNINTRKTALQALKQGQVNNRILTDISRALQPLEDISLTYTVILK
jgi:hypothetical protein